MLMRKMLTRGKSKESLSVSCFFHNLQYHKLVSSVPIGLESIFKENPPLQVLPVIIVRLTVSVAKVVVQQQTPAWQLHTRLNMAPLLGAGQ